MKLFLYLFVVFVPFTCIAQTMCVRDNTLVISLDSGIKPEHHAYNTSEFIWWADFLYDRIYGDATCLSVVEGLGRTTGEGTYYGVEDFAKTTITAASALSGTDIDGNERLYCWCRLAHPVTSAWVFINAFASVSACHSGCSGWCSDFYNHRSMLRGLFSSVGL